MGELMRPCPFCQKPMGPPSIALGGMKVYACPCGQCPENMVIDLDALDSFARQLTARDHDPGDEDRS